jgi:hypothetical protein
MESILNNINEIKNLLVDIENKLNKKKAVVYVIRCLDKNILDEYIGSTYYLLNRKSKHKIDCEKYNNKLYSFVKNNGGWNNFEFIILEEFECETSLEKNQKEQEYIQKYKPTLNTRRALRTHKELQQQWILASQKYRNKNKLKK